MRKILHFCSCVFSFSFKKENEKKKYQKINKEVNVKVVHSLTGKYKIVDFSLFLIFIASLLSLISFIICRAFQMFVSN